MHTRFFGLAAALAFASGGTAAAAANVPVEIGTLDGVRDLGRAPASVQVQIAVVLNYHHQRELDRLVEAQADPGSHLYHHFLTPRQFRGYFSPTPAEYGRVISALQRDGFRITWTFPNDTVVDAVAPAPVAARYFNTDIRRVLSPNIGLTYTNTRPGVVPPEIADLTLGVFGLDAAHVLYARPIPLPPGVVRPVRLDVRRNGSPLFGPDGGYGPQILVDAYDLPAANGNTGTGRASGVDIDGDVLDSDLAAYLSYFGVSRTGPPTTRIEVDGGAPGFPNGDAGEATEDEEAIVSLAPGTALYMYEMPSLSDAVTIDVFNRVVSDNLVDTLNSSFGGCELQQRSYARSLDAIEEQGSAEGITFHAGAGDQGSHGKGCWRKVSVEVPASTPHDIAAGGTTLSVNAETGEETSENGWDGPGLEATGGGVSAVFDLPSYQKTVPNIIARGRNLPDLALDGNPVTGMSFYFNGAFAGPTGGTSLSSPIFGAALAAINQLQTSRSGYFNVTLYKTWLAHGYGSGSTLYFRDIVQGSIPPYYAQPGYDQMSGIGALQANNFAGLLQH